MAGPDLHEAERLLALVARGEQVTFLTFGEGRAKGRMRLTRELHGTLAEHAGALKRLNASGAGVFVMVNAGDGRGRKADCVRRVRALFVDLDGSPLEPVKLATLRPHCIIESSRGRWHAYWRVADCPLEGFRALQQALAARFDGDVRVNDLPRVMRLPGFDHRKGAPFRSRIVDIHDAPAYRLAELVAAFDLNSPTAQTMPAHSLKPMRCKLPDVIPEGERNSTLLSAAAGLVRRGFNLPGVVKRLQRINAERCQPEPLCATEVDAIAARAVGYGSTGFTILTHTLQDSPEWHSLAPAVHDIILLALRRFDGEPASTIALTFADFAGRPGFSDRKTFYMHRNAAVACGFLVRVSEGRNCQSGRKPDLFAITPKWLHTPSAKWGIPTMRQVGNPNPYIDKQLSGDLSSGRASGCTPKPKKDRAA